MPRRFVFWAVAALAVLAAAWQAWALRWSCDDAYVSFRYAQHFAEGHGLVYNLDPREPPVEGYTNFAWTMWLALGWWLGCTDPGIETWASLGGVACHAATVALLAAIGGRLGGGRAWAPVAACGYAALHHAASLAPAGLETALFVLLVTAMLRFGLSLRCAREAWLLGFLGVLAAMTRPDGALLVAAAGGFVLYDAARRRAPSLLVGYVVPFVLVFVPYLLWRRAYYGHWVPNTFFAKSGGDPYVGQGFAYVGAFAACYWALVPALPLVGWFLLRRPDPLAPLQFGLGRRPWAAIAAFVLPYLAFVVWVGGDFMFGRFLLPVLPALLLAFDVAGQRWRHAWLPPVLAAGLVAGLTLRAEPAWLADFANPHGFSDNRAISVMEAAPGLPRTEAFRRAGERLRELFAGLEVRIAFGGSQANLAFRSRVPVAIELYGLTDAFIARRPLARRGPVGHEKGYLECPGYYEQRGVHFHFEGAYGRGDEWRRVVFPGEVPVGAQLVVYDRDLMRELRRRAPDLVAVDLEQHLDDYLAQLGGRPREQVAADYAKFRAAWFDHTPDPARQQAFERFLGR
ncbi:MAG: hypothetical protein KF830_14110 [Planctomycetes bacterium]|nr:hypothetical protein [Planctomycetota bacterium]